MNLTGKKDRREQAQEDGFYRMLGLPQHSQLLKRQRLTSTEETERIICICFLVPERCTYHPLGRLLLSYQGIDSIWDSKKHLALLLAFLILTAVSLCQPGRAEAATEVRERHLCSLWPQSWPRWDSRNDRYPERMPLDSCTAISTAEHYTNAGCLV